MLIPKSFISYFKKKNLIRNFFLFKRIYSKKKINKYNNNKSYFSKKRRYNDRNYFSSIFNFKKYVNINYRRFFKIKKFRILKKMYVLNKKKSNYLLKKLYSYINMKLNKIKNSAIFLKYKKKSFFGILKIKKTAKINKVKKKKQERVNDFMRLKKTILDFYANKRYKFKTDIFAIKQLCSKKNKKNKNKLNKIFRTSRKYFRKWVLFKHYKYRKLVQKRKLKKNFYIKLKKRYYYCFFIKKNNNNINIMKYLKNKSVVNNNKISKFRFYKENMKLKFNKKLRTLNYIKKKKKIKKFYKKSRNLNEKFFKYLNFKFIKFKYLKRSKQIKDYYCNLFFKQKINSSLFINFLSKKRLFLSFNINFFNFNMYNKFLLLENPSFYSKLFNKILQKKKITNKLNYKTIFKFIKNPSISYSFLKKIKGKKKRHIFFAKNSYVNKNKKRIILKKKKNSSQKKKFSKISLNKTAFFSFFFKLNKKLNKTKDLFKKFNRYEYRRMSEIQKYKHLKTKIYSLRFLAFFQKKLKISKKYENINLIKIVKKYKNYKKKIYSKKMKLKIIMKGKKTNMHFLNLDVIENMISRFFKINNKLNAGNLSEDEDSLAFTEINYEEQINQTLNTMYEKKKTNQSKYLITDDIIINDENENSEFFLQNDIIETLQIYKFINFRYFFKKNIIKFKFLLFIKMIRFLKLSFLLNINQETRFLNCKPLRLIFNQ